MNTAMQHFKRLRYGIVGSALFALLATPMAYAAPPAPPSLHVQAQSWVEVEPDKATLSARLWENTPAVSTLEDTDSEALGSARERLEQRASELIAAMEEIGIEQRAINAGSLLIRPDYVQAPSRQGESEAPLVRTQLERPISVRIDALDRVPTILDALTQAGVQVVERVALTTGLNPHNEHYLSTKAGKLGHMMALGDFTQADDVDIEKKS